MAVLTFQNALIFALGALFALYLWPWLQAMWVTNTPGRRSG